MVPEMRKKIKHYLFLCKHLFLKNITKTNFRREIPKNFKFTIQINY